MSRIGKLPVAIPSGVNVDVAEDLVKVKGPKGELQQPILRHVTVKLQDGQLVIERKGDAKEQRAAHGLTRTLLNNMVQGVTKGYRKSLELQGVGYRVAKAGEKLNLSLGRSHPVTFDPPKGVSFVVEGQTKIHVEGIDKQLVGQVAADIRKLRPPEPYKGKGIRYDGEIVKKKLGKAGKAAKK
ncbi:MAG TPA: 50S ribosomal protein L6 [Candidatus Acidoferrales bacterium]|nr:50S ribosomal protein L6 [Candidatus Acidoferrales bacterium]